MNRLTWHPARDGRPDSFWAATSYDGGTFRFHVGKSDGDIWTAEVEALHGATVGRSLPLREHATKERAVWACGYWLEARLKQDWDPRNRVVKNTREARERVKKQVAQAAGRFRSACANLHLIAKDGADPAWVGNEANDLLEEALESALYLADLLREPDEEWRKDTWASNVAYLRHLAQGIERKLGAVTRRSRMLDLADKLEQVEGREPEEAEAFIERARRLRDEAGA